MTRFTLSVAIMMGLCGCSLIAPDFDIPTDDMGIQRTRSIVERIRCELRDFVKADIDRSSPNQSTLIHDDYQFAASIYLDVTNKAGLSPTAGFPDTMKYVFNIGSQLDLSRQDSITINIAISLREIGRSLQYYTPQKECPSVDTHLAGDLGLRRRAEMAMSTGNYQINTELSPSTGEFSGTIIFISTYAITSAGPTWTFRDFTGPGQFASASRVYTDRLTYAFATGTNAGKFVSGVPLARRLILEQNQNDALSQLAGLRNGFR